MIIMLTEKEIDISKELFSKIKWAISFTSSKDFKIYKGKLRIIQGTNLAYVEPHKLVLNNTLFLFFNGNEYFYVNNLENKYPLSSFRDYLKNNK